MRIHRWPSVAIRRTGTYFREAGYRRLARQHAFGDFRRIYHYHIRKTGGTSVVKMFLALSGEPGDDVFDELSDAQPFQLAKNGYVFAGWQKPVIEAGNYFFAFSHIPMHELSLPKGTFTFTCFRDPVARLVSHYRMLLDMRKNEIKHPCFEIEGKWLGDSFEHFLDRIPREHLLNQLYMFSREFDIQQALDRVEELNFVIHLERLNDGIEQLKRVTGQNLEMRHSRKSRVRFSLTEAEKTHVRELLEPEYRFLGQVRNDG